MTSDEHMNTHRKYLVPIEQIHISAELKMNITKSYSSILIQSGVQFSSRLAANT